MAFRKRRVTHQINGPGSRTYSTNPVRALAAAVITRAVLDAQGIGVKCGDRHKTEYRLIIDSARQFLSGSVELKIWCALAQISYERVLKAYQVLGRNK